MWKLQGVVELAAISGADAFVHVDTPWGELVAQLTGVHYFELGAQVRLHLNPAQAYVFGADETLVLAPSAREDAEPWHISSWIWPIPIGPTRSRAATACCCRWARPMRCLKSSRTPSWVTSLGHPA